MPECVGVFFALLWQADGPVLRAISSESHKRKVLSVKELSAATSLKSVISVTLPMKPISASEDNNNNNKNHALDSVIISTFYVTF